MSRPRQAPWGILLLVSGVLALPTFAQAGNDRVKQLLHEAREHERRFDWDRACDCYEAALRLQRDFPDLRPRYQQCLRHVWQLRRHQDLSYRKEVLDLEYGQAIRLFGIVRDTLLDGSIHKRKLDPARLFRSGLDELDAALADPFFLQQHLAGSLPGNVSAFRATLAQTVVPARMSRGDLARQMREVALAAQNELGLPATVVVMEFACGACYACDDYSVYLTPSQLRELCHALKGETVGVGLALALEDGKVLIQEVARFSPAAELLPPLLKDDQIVRINKKAVAEMEPEAAAQMLEGNPGTTVEIELLTSAGPRVVTLRRRATPLASVAYDLKNDRVGYLHIASFHDNTVQEVDAALLALHQGGMKALLLDLRGNGGGVFESAIDVARRFLSTGVIASTVHQDPRFNAVYQAKAPASVTVPVVVLIDADTASAAEVLAGALKDHQRARLVGQTTFGKGCTQCVLKLPAAAGVPTGGLRVTLARFFSPRGEAYSGKGITPDVFVERLDAADSMMAVLDPTIQSALAEAERLLRR